jgi:hypothetical protein
VNQVSAIPCYILEGQGWGDFYKKGLIEPVSLENIREIITFLEFYL